MARQRTRSVPSACIQTVRIPQVAMQARTERSKHAAHDQLREEDQFIITLMRYARDEVGQASRTLQLGHADVYQTLNTTNTHIITILLSTMHVNLIAIVTADIWEKIRDSLIFTRVVFGEHCFRRIDDFGSKSWSPTPS